MKLRVYKQNGVDVITIDIDTERLQDTTEDSLGWSVNVKEVLE